MAIRIRFDRENNAIQPTFVLAKKSGEKLGFVPVHSVNFSDNMNAKNELQLIVYKYDNGNAFPLWDEIKDFRLLWCPEWDEWFEITVELEITADDIVKHISANSLGEAELSQINVYEMQVNTEDDIARDDYEPTVLYDENNANCSLLDRLLEKAPHYTIGHVDDSIKNIQRTFEFDDTSIYDALQEIAEEINCIFLINSGSETDGSISRSISAYDLYSYCVDCGERGSFLDECPSCGGHNILHGYGEDTTIYISTDNLADNITYSSDTESVKNCFRLEAGDDLMTAAVRNCNPNGSNYLWYIPEETRVDMSDALRSKLDTYDTLYSYYRDEHEITVDSDLLDRYNAIVTKYQAYDNTIPQIRSPIVGYQNLLAAYYNTIDLALYLRSSLYPSPTITDVTAAGEAAKVNLLSASSVAVSNLSTCSLSTATSSVLSMVKTVVDSRFQVKTNANATYTNHVWTGSFTITRLANEEDTATTSTIQIQINDDRQTYIQQKINKAMANKAIDNTDVSELFHSDITDFNTQIKQYSLNGLLSLRDACEACITILIEQGVADPSQWTSAATSLYNQIYLPYYTKMNAIEAEIQVRESELDTVVGVMDENGVYIQDGMQSFIVKTNQEIQDTLNFEDYVGTSLWHELASFRRESTYENSNYISDGLGNNELIKNAQEFLKVAQNELFKSATLQHSISASLKNLLVMKEFKPIVDFFSVGNWIRLRVDKNVYRLRLISYSIDFENLNSFSVDFSDVMKVSTGVDDLSDILSQAESIASTYESITRQACQGAVARKQLNEWKVAGLALTQMKILDTAANQNLQIDEYGILCREYMPFEDTYADKQLRIINRGLYLTDDGWETSRAGIGDFYYFDPNDGQEKQAYGVVADVLIGNLILSETVGIYNKDNTVKLDKNGLTIISDSTATNPAIFKVQKRSYNANSEEVLEDVIWMDNSGNAHFKGNLEAAGGTFSGDISAASGTFTGGISFNTSGTSATVSRVDINKNVGIKVSDSNGNYFQVSSNAMGFYNSSGSPYMYVSNNQFYLSLLSNYPTKSEMNSAISSISVDADSIRVQSSRISWSSTYSSMSSNGILTLSSAVLTGSFSGVSNGEGLVIEKNRFAAIKNGSAIFTINMPFDNSGGGTILYFDDDGYYRSASDSSTLTLPSYYVGATPPEYTNSACSVAAGGGKSLLIGAAGRAAIFIGSSGSLWFCPSGDMYVCNRYGSAGKAKTSSYEFQGSDGYSYQLYFVNGILVD